MEQAVNNRTDNLKRWLDLQRGDFPPGQSIQLPMLSGSMLPLLVPGHDIVIEAVSWRECRRGDIIVFRQEEKLTAHRLLLPVPYVDSALFYQKGDANDFGGWIRSHQVVGVVAAVKTASGGRLDLREKNARTTARFEARRQLARDLWARVLYLPRKVWQRVRRRAGGTT
ncbi:MAG: hypothetical protein ABIF77_03660 [bacterium]